MEFVCSHEIQYSTWHDLLVTRSLEQNLFYMESKPNHTFQTQTLTTKFHKKTIHFVKVTYHNMLQLNGQDRNVNSQENCHISLFKN